MTVKELKQRLEKFPEHMEVFMDERSTEFRYGLLNSVSCREIDFVEEPGDEPLATDTVVILSEE